MRDGIFLLVGFSGVDGRCIDAMMGSYGKYQSIPRALDML